MSEQHLTDTVFADLELAPVLLHGIQEAGFRNCTPIQAATLPLALEGRDVAGQAQTGTGKSAAFLLAAFHYLLTHPAPEGRRATQPRALMLAPTRELAIQIHKDAEVLGRHTGLSLGLVYGGTGYDSQRQMMEQGVDVLIGTPGRIIDYFKQKVFDLKAAQVLVLDEADRMFDLGFIKDIRYLLHRMPPPTERLNMLFSATMSFRVNELAYDHMNNPSSVIIEPDKKTADKVKQVLYHSANEEKIPLLIGLMRSMDPGRSLVFTNTKETAETVRAWLTGNGFETAVLSGDVPQKKRQSLLAEFSEGKLPILIATDVAARGLHIPEVSHVFNYDLPQDAEDYVHRIGRTARAGASGDAISFACENYAYSLMDIEDYIGHKLEVAKIGADLLPELQPPDKIERPQRGRNSKTGERGGRRDGGKRQGRSSARSDSSGSERSGGRARRQAGDESGRDGDKSRPAAVARNDVDRPDAPLAPKGRKIPEGPAIG